MRFYYADERMPFAMTMGSTTYYLAYDQVGTLRTVAYGSGTVVKRIDYDSFGNIINDTNPSLKVPFGFAGGLYDKDTKLVRFGFRDYDPDTGRWTAKDPIGFGGGDADLYGYCVNDPVNFADPWGLEARAIYSTERAAAVAAGADVRARSQQDGFEWATWVCKKSDGSGYYYTEPKTDKQKKEVYPEEPKPEEAIAPCHSHSKSVGAEYSSPGDSDYLKGDKCKCPYGYLASPEQKDNAITKHIPNNLQKEKAGGADVTLFK